MDGDERDPMTPARAWGSLREGNARFVTGRREHPNQDADHRARLATGQNPFAIAFGCSDSRVAAETIFDRGLGDLFVVRTAGHVGDAEVPGSIGNIGDDVGDVGDVEDKAGPEARAR